MQKKSDINKLWSHNKISFFLSSICLNIFMIILMLLETYNYFGFVSTIILAKDSLVDIEASLFGLNFITESQNFYFQSKVTTYLIILLIYDFIILIMFLYLEIYKKYKSNRENN